MERIEAMKATLKFARQMWADHMTLGKLDPEPPAFAIVEQMIAEAEAGVSDPVEQGLEFLRSHGMFVVMQVTAAEVIERTNDLHEINLDDAPTRLQAMAAIRSASDALWENGGGLQEVVAEVVNDASDNLYAALFGVSGEAA